MWVHRYSLVPKAPLSARAGSGVREGALLHVGDGYADIHPWPELGDASLDEQLALLRRGEATPLTARSLTLAAIDGGLRRQGRSAFDGLQIPASHYPAGVGEAAPDDFDTVKIKCGPDFDPQGLDRWRGKRLRLDFNATLSPEQFALLGNSLPKDQIDFVEDPCPYDAEVWLDLRGRTGIRLALDRQIGEGPAEVRIVKPAVQDIDEIIAASSPESEIVVTSYMDHALGQMCAAWTAARYAKRLSARCGLFTHVRFEPDEFFDRVRNRGAVLLPPAGTGFGFDDLLQNLPWKKLS